MPVALAGTIWFWKRRHIQPIKARMPYLVLCNDVILMLFVLALCIQRIYEETYPCMLNLWSGFIGLIMLFTGYLWRCWSLYFTFHLTRCRIEMKSLETMPFFIRNRHYISAPFLIRVLGTVSIIFLFPCAILTAKNFRGLNGYGDKTCDKAWGDGLQAAYAAAYVTIFCCFAFKLRNVRDVFGIQQELKITGLIGIICLLPWTIFNTAAEEFNAAVFPFSTFFLLMAVAQAFFTSTLWPLYRSIYRQTEEDATKLPENVDTLTGVLSSPPGVRAFKEFLIKEFSVENLLFFMEVEQFRGACAGRTDLNATFSEASKIYSKYIELNAPFQVNLPSTTVSELKLCFFKKGTYFTGMSPSSVHVMGDSKRKRSIDEQLPAIFDAAQKQIFKLMETDSCPRFYRSSLYKEFCAKVGHLRHETDVMRDMGVA